MLCSFNTKCHNFPVFKVFSKCFTFNSNFIIRAGKCNIAKIKRIHFLRRVARLQAVLGVGFSISFFFCAVPFDQKRLARKVVKFNCVKLFFLMFNNIIYFKICLKTIFVISTLQTLQNLYKSFCLWGTYEV